MDIKPKQIPIRDLISGYTNSPTEGVYGYGGKLNIRLDTLLMNGENPRIVAWPCIVSRFASHAHFLNASVKIGR